MFEPVDPLTNAPLETELVSFYSSTSNTRYMQLSSANIPGIAAGKRYRVYVQPVFDSGNGNYDMVSTFYVQMISSGGMAIENGTDAMVTRSFVSESNESTSIAVYPNPSNGEVFNLNVSGIAEGLWEMSILDIQGKEVMNGQLISENGINTMVVPSTKLTSGIYMINLTNGTEILSTRLVVR
jgi:Secretion system C-terminal sorting domain